MYNVIAITPPMNVTRVMCQNIIYRKKKEENNREVGVSSFRNIRYCGCQNLMYFKYDISDVFSASFVLCVQVLGTVLMQSTAGNSRCDS